MNNTDEQFLEQTLRALDMANALLFNANFDISKMAIKPFYDKEYAKFQKMKRERENYEY